MSGERRTLLEFGDMNSPKTILKVKAIYSSLMGWLHSAEILGCCRCHKGRKHGQSGRFAQDGGFSMAKLLLLAATCESWQGFAAWLA